MKTLNLPMKLSSYIIVYVHVCVRIIFNLLKKSQNLG